LLLALVAQEEDLVHQEMLVVQAAAEEQVE
jgi:hypothetical protein